MKPQKIPEGRIFVCVSEKAPEKAACLRGEGEKCVEWLKEELEKRGLGKKIWVTKTKCQKYCDSAGTSIIFEPSNKQYSAVKFVELPELFERFVIDFMAASNS